MGNHRDRLSGVKGAGLALAIGLGLAGPVHAADCPTGDFRAKAGPDTASGLLIEKNGHFLYFLSEGAVDEQAEGRWTCADGALLLTTEPSPKPAEFRLDKVTRGEEAPFSLIVTWPDGNGVAAVDFKIDFEAGEPVTGYTQQDGWSRDFDERLPRTIQFAEPFYGTVSPLFPIPPGKGIKLHVVIDPNDIGTAAFKDTPVTSEEGKLVLHWRGRKIPFEEDAR